jgi:tRNA(fMet)-specific endonuclease VapC
VKYLLDTGIISELVAKKPARQVVDWIDQTDEDQLYLSVLTIGEIRKGIEKLPPSSKKQTLEEWLDEQLRIRFADRIIPVDLDIVLKWGQLTGALENAGKPMAAIDSLIAATALSGNFTLVTRNEEDFKYSKVSVFNPWSE